ncbi:MAG: GMC family oxidoreductase N-terminal domain-containing protein, partial [Anaerolineales bacterium]
LGGGTVVNYTTSFRTPDHLRREWALAGGLGFLTGEDYSRSLDAVCDRLGVNVDHNLPGIRDALMARGLEALGWHVGRMPRNVQGCTQDDACGYCGFGCTCGAKRSTLKTYLQQAFDNGARMLVECAVERVVLEKGRAAGVEAVTRGGHRVTVRARRVVVCAGAIESAALLLRSGVDGPVGENLRLHPVTAVWGLFEEEVRPWTGTIQALYSDEFADLDDGYGLKFETTGIHPLFLTYATAWTGGREFDAAMVRLPHMSPIGVLLRDRYGGRVTVNRAGTPVVHYQVSTYDQRHIRRGVEGAARVLQAAGAREVTSSQREPVAFLRGGASSIEDWLRRVDRVGYGPNQTVYFSWHQMGTCRMGSSRATSVVGETGEAYTVKDLYVADGSLFPSASGVNPMITIAALAHHVAGAIEASLS